MTSPQLIREDGGALPERDFGFDGSWGIARKLAQPQAKLVLPLRGSGFCLFFSTSTSRSLLIWWTAAYIDEWHILTCWTTGNIGVWHIPTCWEATNIDVRHTPTCWEAANIDEWQIPTCWATANTDVWHIPTCWTTGNIDVRHIPTYWSMIFIG